MAASPSLIQWCTEELSRILLSDTSDDFTRYMLAIEDDTELVDYLKDLLHCSDEQKTSFIEELMRRRKDANSTIPPNFTVYRKSADTEDPTWTEARKHKGKSKNKEKKQANQNKENTQPAKTQQPQTAQPPQQKPVMNGLPPQDDHALALQQGARRKTKYVALYSQEGQARTTIHIPGRHPCECQAHKHALVSNCLECGRVVCSQEGSGPCLFCGALVCNKEEQEILARNSKKSEKLRKKLMGELSKPVNGDGSATQSLSSIDKAIAHKERLIEYDKTSERRTQVMDDQSDYFSSDSNQWLSGKEKGDLRRREDELREQRHGSRLQKKFTLDFAGRKVVEQEGGEMYNRQDEVVQRVTFGNKTGDREASREPDTTILNPTIVREPPKFVSSIPSGGLRSSSSSATDTKTASRGNPRVQDRELMEMSDEGRCLSMHQPWASLLVAGIKMHEGRTWYSPHRGRLWIAAAAKDPEQEQIDTAKAAYRHLSSDDLQFPEHFPVGCLLGCVDVVDCLSQEDYREKYPKGESASPFVFICENPQELLIKFQVKGKHKIWRLDGQMHKAAKQGLRQSLQNS
ncbi:activating signal cointegrator 1-like [Diadema antillarum]|uniref:activating signal cointegrator 1-like n=1 Tax=Diadema antillarum TaxID=105358 RepID=UPI003A84EA62